MISERCTLEVCEGNKFSQIGMYQLLTTKYFPQQVQVYFSRSQKDLLEIDGDCLDVDWHQEIWNIRNAVFRYR